MLLAACAPVPQNPEKLDSAPEIYPDYIGVTIPADIAPLNFEVAGADYLYATVSGGRSGSVLADGQYADFDIDDWHQITRKNMGDSLYIHVTARKNGKWYDYQPFAMAVSCDSLSEWGLTYRRIDPGYETYSHIGIYQRNIHDFNEYVIVDYNGLPGSCMNCHVANRCNPESFQLHVRGPHSATLIQQNGRRKLLNTKTDSTYANCMYPYWHPSGKYCAYGVGKIHQVFWESDSRYIEAFEDKSQAVVLDIDNDRLITSPLLNDQATFPVFSSDGNTIYYCVSASWYSHQQFSKMQYNICSLPFDSEKGTIGTEIDTVVNAVALGKSAVHPRPSYDGRFLMFTVSDYTVFPIYHPEAELYLLDLANGHIRCMDEVNSCQSDDYHNWSTNSRWFVFTSRRLNGTNSLLYISHIDKDGHASKPFILPQRNPGKFYREFIQSYNVPDFTTAKVELDMREFRQEVFSADRIQVKCN